MGRLPRIPHWLGVTLASVSAALLVVGSAISDGLSGWWLAAWVMLAAGFAAGAIGVPQLQKWQAEQDARLQVQVKFDPPAPTVPAYQAGASPVISAWLDQEEDRCLASLHHDQAPARDLLGKPSRPGEDHPLRGLTVGDLRRIREKQVAGEQLTDGEERTLEAFRATSRYAMASLGQSLAGLTARMMTAPDDRTPEDYTEQVAKYLAACERRLRSRLLWRYAQEKVALLHPTLFNPTDKVFDNVQVEVYLPGNIQAFDPERIHEPPDGLPSQPRPFGTRKPLHVSGIPGPDLARSLLATPDLDFGGPEIDNTASARIRFDPATLRPHAGIPLDPIVLVVDEPPGTTVNATWHATATNVPGRVEGHLAVKVAEQPLDSDRLLADLPQDG